MGRESQTRMLRRLVRMQQNGEEVPEEFMLMSTRGLSPRNIRRIAYLVTGKAPIPPRWVRVVQKRWRMTKGPKDYAKA